tara:strand:+ start:126 stop:530 length:405 start_codon:yes stop_codon:yes gene_type:complete
MKKILFLISIFFISLFSYSQTETTIPTKDSKSFWWKDGYDKHVEVEFQYFLPDEIELSQESLKNVVMYVMVYSKRSLNNKLSFVPKKFSVLESGGTNTVLFDFYGKNSYGSEGKITGSFEFDLKGTVTEKGYSK